MHLCATWLHLQQLDRPNPHKMSRLFNLLPEDCMTLSSSNVFNVPDLTSIFIGHLIMAGSSGRVFPQMLFIIAFWTIIVLVRWFYSNFYLHLSCWLLLHAYTLSSPFTGSYCLWLGVNDFNKTSSWWTFTSNVFQSELIKVCLAISRKRMINPWSLFLLLPPLVLHSDLVMHLCRVIATVFLLFFSVLDYVSAAFIGSEIHAVLN